MTSKAPCISLFGRRKYVSISGLSEILKEIKEHGVPESTSRSSIKRARDAAFESVATSSYGTVLKRVLVYGDKGDDDTFVWVADPRATLYHMVGTNSRLESFLAERLQEHPSSMTNPWHIILYNDEITSGNPMLRHNHRKAHAYYYSFVELGVEALSSEFLWFTLSITRSDTVNSIPGLGAGMLCKSMMLEFEDMTSKGFVCGSIIIFAKLTYFIADESAIKYSLDVMGASGHMCCLKCKNVLSKRAWTTAEGATLVYVRVSELDVSKFAPHTDQSIRANADYLESQKGMISPGDFAQLQTALGLNYAPDGVLLCDRLRHFNPVSGLGFDYHHVYFVHGIFNLEIGLFLDLMKSQPTRTRVRHTDINAFFQNFRWPSFSQVGKTVFEKRSTDGGPLSASASECLGCFAVLQEFVNLRVFNLGVPELQAACVSYYALCEVIVLLSMTPRGTVDHITLKNAIMHHLAMHKQAYGDDHWVPKMHWATHLPDQLRLWGLLIACFTHERKHKEVKRYMEGRQNTHYEYERNILQDVLYIQSRVLTEEHPYPTGVCLLDGHPASKRLAGCVCAELGIDAEVRTSVKAKAAALVTVHVEDVVVIRWDGDTVAIGQVNGLFEVASFVVANVSTWTKTPERNVYDASGGSTFYIHVSDIIDTCIWRPAGNLAYVVPPRGAATV